MSSCLSGVFSDFTPRDSDEQELIPTGLRSGLASEAAPPKYLNQPITVAVSCPSRSFRLLVGFCPLFVLRRSSSLFTLPLFLGCLLFLFGYLFFAFGRLVGFGGLFFSGLLFGRCFFFCCFARTFLAFL